MTGLVIIISGAWTSGTNGAELTSVAFESTMPGHWGGLIVTIALVLFAFSTIIGWCYYGEKSVEYLWGVKVVMPYRVAWVVFVALGATLKLELVWNISDVFNGLMAFPNLVALLLLSPVIAKETRQYFAPEKERLRV
jgi:AGCS family alanine or glycine:cation symporter